MFAAPPEILPRALSRWPEGRARSQACPARRRPPAQSADEVVGKLRRAILLDHRIGFAIVAVLQDRTLAELLAADDDGHRAGGPASLRVNGARGHQIDLALRSGRDRAELDLGVARTAAVVDVLEALEAFRPVEHAVEHPGVGVIVH